MVSGKWIFFFKVVAAILWKIAVALEQPKYVLVEEHHHVVAHLVEFAKAGVLSSHSTYETVENTVNPNGALLIHVDSHADMGLTVGLNRLPFHKLRTQLPSTETETFELIERSVINDFLLLLGFMGIVEHIVFVEPPWSLLMNEAHFTTVDISIGVVPGEDGITYASIENSLSSVFEKATPEGIERIRLGMDDFEEPVEIVSHKELLEHCSGTLGREGCEGIRTVRLTTLPYQGSTAAIQKLLEAEPPNKDIVLDIDLDGFSTTSPSALALLQTIIPDPDLLTRIFHTVHSDKLCDYNPSYWKALIAAEEATSEDTTNRDCLSSDENLVSHPFEPPNEHVGVSSRAYDLLEAAWFVEGDTIREELAKVIDHYYVSQEKHALCDEDTFAQMLHSFLLQPYYVPDRGSIELAMDFHFKVLFRGIFEDRMPRVVNLVRSPFYTPDHHLDFIECEVVDRLFDLFGNDSKLYFTDHVDPDRTQCMDQKFPSHNRVNIGHEENPHIEIDMWQHTFEAYRLFHDYDSDYDDLLVTFVNEHSQSILVTFEDGSSIELPKGEEVESETEHLKKWTFALQDHENEPPLFRSTMQFSGRHGTEQVYGSITGRIAVENVTPVELRITNPSDSGLTVEIRSGNEKNHRKLVPGETSTIQSVHGQEWSCHDLSNRTKILWEGIADATDGTVHSVELFHSEEL